MKKYLLSIFTLIIPFLTFAQETTELGLDQKIDQAFKPFSDAVFGVIFFEVFGIPFVLILLVFSALFFTIYFGFPNVRYFGKAINTVRGKYDEIEGGHQASETSMTVDGDIRDTIRDESQEGEVSHFQALATAVSGTVGNGNIAGVALAIALGGPGATFWMIVCGLLGMSSKFVECTLGVQYRDVGEDGTVYGGPMYYISKGLKERGFKTLGKIAAIFFAIFCIGGSFGGGNAAQSNQATIVLKDLLGLDNAGAGFWIGVVLAVLVGIIIIGGIKRIASVTEKVVPFMAVFYLLACLYIIGSNFSLVDDAIGLIITEAFNPTAIGVGSLIGVLLVGFKRAAFSNEAGAGSASIAHSAVKTKYSASEGLVALLEPFIDTVVICTMTALVLIITGYHDVQGVEGAQMTSQAFGSVFSWFPYILVVAIFLFAFSTMISWSYYGLKAWTFLFGKSKVSEYSYKLLFLVFIVIGSSVKLGAVLDFSDMMILAMAFPNIIGLLILSKEVRVDLDDYYIRLKSGVIKRFK